MSSTICGWVSRESRHACEPTHRVDHLLLDKERDAAVEDVSLGRDRAGLEAVEYRLHDFEEGGCVRVSVSNPMGATAQ